MIYHLCLILNFDQNIQWIHNKTMKNFFCEFFNSKLWSKLFFDFLRFEFEELNWFPFRKTIFIFIYLAEKVKKCSPPWPQGRREQKTVERTRPSSGNRSFNSGMILSLVVVLSFAKILIENKLLIRTLIKENFCSARITIKLLCI